MTSTHNLRAVAQLLYFFVVVFFQMGIFFLLLSRMHCIEILWKFAWLFFVFLDSKKKTSNCCRVCANENGRFEGSDIRHSCCVRAESFWCGRSNRLSLLRIYRFNDILNWLWLITKTLNLWTMNSVVSVCVDYQAIIHHIDGFWNIYFRYLSLYFHVFSVLTFLFPLGQCVTF